jgi:hypothetical protein
MQQTAENIWLLRYPMPVLGVDFSRNVSIVRLTSGKLVIHSTARFSSEDVSVIRQLGEPGWLVDATMLHDTFVPEGQTAFPDLLYLTPKGFAEANGLRVASRSSASRVDK